MSDQLSNSSEQGEKKGILEKIPVILSSKLSIFIYLFLFFYLVIFALACLLIPAFNGSAPSNDMQLVMGNYTNVLSALGASIAAGVGTNIHASVKKLHKRHDALKDSVDELQQKHDRLKTSIDSLHEKIDGLKQTDDNGSEKSN